MVLLKPKQGTTDQKAANLVAAVVEDCSGPIGMEALPRVSMVEDYLLDMEDSSGPMWVQAWRCMDCDGGEARSRPASRGGLIVRKARRKKKEAGRGAGWG